MSTIPHPAGINQHRLAPPDDPRLVRDDDTPNPPVAGKRNLCKLGELFLFHGMQQTRKCDDSQDDRPRAASGDGSVPPGVDTAVAQPRPAVRGMRVVCMPAAATVNNDWRQVRPDASGRAARGGRLHAAGPALGADVSRQGLWVSVAALSNDVDVLCGLIRALGHASAAHRLAFQPVQPTPHRDATWPRSEDCCPPSLPRAPGRREPGASPQARAVEGDTVPCHASSRRCVVEAIDVPASTAPRRRSSNFTLAAATAAHATNPTAVPCQVGRRLSPTAAPGARPSRHAVEKSPPPGGDGGEAGDTCHGGRLTYYVHVDAPTAAPACMTCAVMSRLAVVGDKLNDCWTSLRRVMAVQQLLQSHGRGGGEPRRGSRGRPQLRKQLPSSSAGAAVATPAAACGPRGGDDNAAAGGCLHFTPGARAPADSMAAARLHQLRTTTAECWAAFRLCNTLLRYAGTGLPH